MSAVVYLSFTFEGRCFAILDEQLLFRLPICVLIQPLELKVVSLYNTYMMWIFHSQYHPIPAPESRLLVVSSGNKPEGLSLSLLGI